MLATHLDIRDRGSRQPDALPELLLREVQPLPMEANEPSKGPVERFDVPHHSGLHSIQTQSCQYHKHKFAIQTLDSW